MGRIAVVVFLFLLGCTGMPKAPSGDSRAPATQQHGQEVVVGIFGDLHEKNELGLNLFDQFKKYGVTHVIGLGDFILFGGIPALEQILSPISSRSGVPKENIFLLPGNWEQTLNDPTHVNQVLRTYGNLVTNVYHQSGVINIQGERILASHFPQHGLPEALKPPAKFIRSIEGQVTLVETFQREKYPAPDIAFELFSHTHIGGIYFDQASGKWVMNPGVMDERKDSREPKAYILYFQKRKIIRFMNVETDKVLLDVSLQDPEEPCRKGCGLRDEKQ